MGDSCKKIDKKTQFEITIDKAVEIPSLVGINLPFNLPTQPIETEIKKELEIKNKKKKKIEYIKLTELNLRTLQPSGKNFNFLKDIEIYMSSEQLPEILIAKAFNMPNLNLTEVSIPVIQDVDLTEYI